MEAVLILVSKAALQPAQNDAVIAAACPAVRRLNRKLCDQARYSDDVTSLASPVIGGAINIGRVDKLFLQALASGASSPQELARFVIRALAPSGTRLLKDGKIADTPEADMEEAVKLAHVFKDALLPLLKALHIEC